MENLTNNLTADEIASTTPAIETTGEPVTEQAPTIPSTPEETVSAVSEEVFPNAAVPEASTILIDNTPAKKPYVVEKTRPGLECYALKELDDPADLKDVSTSDSAPVAPTASAVLPADYLANGYYATTDKGVKYLRPEFVGEYAETMANLLSDMKPSDFTGLLIEMKRSRKRALPFEARLTAVTEMLPKAMALVSRKKAPALLVTFIKDNIDHIHNDDDWTGFFRHLGAISAYLAAQKGGAL